MPWAPPASALWIGSALLLTLVAALAFQWRIGRGGEVSVSPLADRPEKNRRHLVTAAMAVIVCGLAMATWAQLVWNPPLMGTACGILACATIGRAIITELGLRRRALGAEEPVA